ncbi:MAG: hypothetical protein ACKVQA_02980 [Burkholderiales bacterium]
MPKHSPDCNMVIGVAWFYRDHWQRLTEVAENRNELDDTFEEWERNALKAVQTMERQGQSVKRVYIDTDALASWCKAKGLSVHGKSRAQYVSFLLRQCDGKAEA